MIREIKYIVIVSGKVNKYITVISFCHCT